MKSVKILSDEIRIYSFKQNKYINFHFMDKTKAEFLLNITSVNNSLFMQLRTYNAEKQPTFYTVSFISNELCLSISDKKKTRFQVIQKSFFSSEDEDNEISFDTHDNVIIFSSSFDSYLINLNKIIPILNFQKEKKLYKKIIQLGKKFPDHQVIKITVKDKNE